METFAAVLVLTDTSTLTRLSAAEPSWKPMAIRYEDAKEIDQLAFFDREVNAITHVAILDSEEPWVPCYVPGKPVTFLPNIQEVLDCIDGPEINGDTIAFMDGMKVLPQHNVEGVIIDDLDAVLNDDELLPSIIQDEFILNRRNINTIGALNYLQREGLDLMALAEEFTEVAPAKGEQMAELPGNWKKAHWQVVEIGHKEQEVQDRILYLLNSAFTE